MWYFRSFKFSRPRGDRSNSSAPVHLNTLRGVRAVAALAAILYVSTLTLPAAETAPAPAPASASSALHGPIAVYNNWSAYDELSDNVELTEELALRQLHEILRLRKAGVRMDYYLMDAFWYDPKGGYRTFRKPHWPDGPDRWLAECRAAGIKPGLWLACNVRSKLELVPEWKSSLTAERTAMCMFEGGFLDHFMETLQLWHDRGVRMFKFDFARLGAATPAAAARMTEVEIVEANTEALRTALRQFRRRNPDTMFLAFNGFGGQIKGTFYPIEQTVDRQWLEVFDTLYCGDPRPSDVPTFNFWRSKDIYSDHMVRYYEANGIPLERIDNTGFMVGTTGTCYRRGTEAWEGMAILEHARGGWLNHYYGNLELLDEQKAAWFAKVQRLFFPLLSEGRTATFGGLPGRGEPYGFVSTDATGAVCTVVNPSQVFASVSLPHSRPDHGVNPVGRLLFADAGFQPVLNNDAIQLGPEQMAVVGFGAYSRPEWDLGTGQDIRIPQAAKPLPTTIDSSHSNEIRGETRVLPGHNLRILLRQTVDGLPLRISGGPPPKGKPLDTLIIIEVRQAGRALPLRTQYGKAIWSGLSWASGEVPAEVLDANQPLSIKGSTTASGSPTLHLECYAVQY